MIDFLIFLTYVAEGIAFAAIIFGLGVLVRSGPPSEAERTTYWMRTPHGDEQLSRREYDLLVNERESGSGHSVDVAEWMGDW